MANPTCAPYDESPMFVDRQRGETDEAMLDELASVVARQKSEVREGIDNSDAANAAVIYSHVKAMSGMDIATANRYFETKLKNAGTKSDPMMPVRKQQMAAAATQYWTRRMAGLRDMASSYLLQRKEGQKGLVQAVEFFGQLKTFNDMGKTIQELNLSAGSALRQRKIGKGLDNAQFEYQNANIMKEGAENLAGYQKFGDEISQIADLINAGKIDEALKLADKIASHVKILDDPQKIAGVVNRWKQSWNTWDEVWINGLLSSPTTFATNVASVAWVAARPLLQLGTAELIAKTTGAKSAKLAAAEASAYLGEIHGAFTDALHLAWMAAKTEKSLFQPFKKQITGDNLRNALTESRLGETGKPVGPEQIYKLADVVGATVRLPSRGLLAGDEFVKVLASRGQVAANGVYKASLEGVDLTDKRAVQGYIQNEMEFAFDVNAGSLQERYRFSPRDNTGEVDPTSRANIYNQARALPVSEGGLGRNTDDLIRRAAFQEDNKVADAVAQVRRWPIVGGVLSRFVPFVRTPSNIIKQGFWEGTGASTLFDTAAIFSRNFNNPQKAIMEIQQQMLNDPDKQYIIMGQMALSTLAVGQMYNMAMNGQITGGGPDRWTPGAEGRKAQDAWKAAGNVPYSIDLGNGYKLPFDRLGEPFTLVMKMAADLGMFSAYMTQEEQDQSFAYITSITTSSLYNSSFLRGFNDFMNIVGSVNDPARLNYQLGRGMQNWVATQTPFGGLLAYVDRVDNPYKAAYESTTATEMLKFWEISLGEGIFGKLVNKIPGVGTTPMLQDQLTGLPVPIVPGTGPTGIGGALQQAIPFMPRQSKADAVWQAVMDIKGSYTEKSYGQNIKLLPVEQQRFNVVMSSIVLKGKTLAQAIMEFRARPDVQKFVDNKGATIRGAEIQDELDSIIRRYAERTKVQLAMSDPNLRERLTLADLQKKAKDANNVEEVNMLNRSMDELLQRARRGY